MTDRARARRRRRVGRASGGDGGGSAFYFLGFIGALVFFVKQADGVGENVVAVLKAFVWPAFLVYEAFQALIG